MFGIKSIGGSESLLWPWPLFIERPIELKALFARSLHPAGFGSFVG